MNGFPLLTLIIFIPLLGALVIMAVPKTRLSAVKWLALVFTAIPTALALYAYGIFERGTPDMQFVEKISWVPEWGINYSLGVDGLSMPLLALTALMTMLCVIGAWKYTHRVKEFFALLLFLDVGMLGVFAALDYILFYVFWDIVIVPMYFLIGIWGGPRREYAAIKFFIYTFLGSVFMLLAILAMYFYGGATTFGILELREIAPTFSAGVQIAMFVGFYLAFAVKVPVFPFHTWLPDAHVEAPTIMSVLLAAILLKMGLYGFMRISIPTLPDAWDVFIPMFAVLGVVNIIYGSYLALAQTDLKKLIAYSSIGHMGFAMLGLAANNALGFTGAYYVMMAHGVISAMLFFLVGSVYDRSKTRQIPEIGGLSDGMPKLGGLLVFTSLASMGLPGLAGFWGEYFSIFGAVQAGGMYVYVVLALFGLIITTAYFVYMMQRVNWGEVRHNLKGLPDVSRRELTYYVPLVALTIVWGVYPAGLLDWTNSTIAALAALTGG